MMLMGPPCSPQTSTCTPVWCPHLNTERLHVGWNGLLRSWESSWRGRSCSLICRIRNFGSCGLLRGWLRNSGTGGMVRLFRRRLGWEKVGVWCTSPQEPIETFCLWPYHSFPHFPHPSVSNCCTLSSSLCTSSLSKLALCSKSNPWKKTR